MRSFNDDQHAEHTRTRPPLPVRWPGWRAFLKNFNGRDCWWFLLDYLESHASLRRWAYSLLTIAVLLVALGLWAYPRWNRSHSMHLARQWLASGHYKYAADAVQDAMIADPESPEPWLLAAELARLGGQNHQALTYSQRAAELAPHDPDVLTNWGADALRANQLEDVDRALDQIPVELQAQSPHVQRLRGELARRQQRYTPARSFFEAAIKLEGPLAVNEVPLGLVLLHATDARIRQHGLDLLAKWAADKDWGATAARMLLIDARARGDNTAMFQWAETLRNHPGCTVSDMPDCLLALAQTNEARFRKVLAKLEQDHAVSPKAAAELLSWLNQIGRGREAVDWIKTLPPAAMHRPPLVVVAAESFRLAAEWSDLFAWTQKKDWGRDVEFLRWAYGLYAAQKIGDRQSADELWATLYSHAQLNSVHALFAASTLYSWGLQKEGLDLWWRTAEQEGKIAIDALGSLARHYQVNRDADGQYRVFHRLYLLKPHDAAIGNNLAFFAALTGREQRNADLISSENMSANPRDPIYAATRAFVLFTQNDARKALELLQTFSEADRESPAVAFAYGLALAKANRKTEARAVLGRLPPESLTQQEVALIQRTLAD